MTIIVGIRHPSNSTGVDNGRVLVQPPHLTSVQAQLEARALTVLSRDSILPFFVVRLSEYDELEWIMSRPWLDYVEPAAITNVVGYQSDGPSGCQIPVYADDRHTTSLAGISDMVPVTYNSMRIPTAWDLSSGAGVTVGLTDTGIYSSSAQLNWEMLNGHSANRQFQYLYTPNYASPFIDDQGCSHGPRMAGVIAAPRDDNGPIGVAWGSNLVSVRHNESVDVWDTHWAVNALHMAAMHSEIVVIAWGALEWEATSVSDAIRYWHYNHDRLFIGAAGTYWMTPYLLRKVIFPANLPEVIAVTAADWPSGTLNSDAAQGSAVELAAYIGQPTVSTGDGVASIGGSSNAAAVIAGIAALTWSRYPHLTRDELRQRLFYSANGNPWATAGVKAGDLGYGIPNAYKAVGGFWHLNIDGPECVDGRPGNVQLLANARGDGPFTFQWSTGETTKTISLPSPARGEEISAHVYVHDGLQGLVRSAFHTVTALAVDDPRRACD
jgi:serine protease